MTFLRTRYITAIVMMAVLFIGLQMTGCVTSRHIDELKLEHKELNAKLDETQAKVDAMESIIQQGADANNKLRVDLSSTADYTQEQLAALLENYDMLLRLVQEMNAALKSKSILKGSIGSEETTKQNNTTKPSVQDDQTAITLPEKPAIDCGDTYDESFIMVRRGEYQNAIDGFNKYLENCPEHESVENAHYWIGECFYSLEKYVDAVTKFEYLLENHKGSVKTAQALYKLGRSQQELGNTDTAKKIFKQLVDEHPNTLEASQAQERLKDLK